MIRSLRRKETLWTAAEAAAATGGRTDSDWSATGVSIDSRTVEPGDLFVAIQGPNFDGHEFVSDALTNGASAVMVSRLPGSGVATSKVLVVDDCLEALRALGGAARDRSCARVIAVTGSVGKTGTKEALRLALGRHQTVHANPGSLNNHWGLPLTLARLPRDADFGVFEMGMNHPGEIAPLSRLARPHVALITTVEPVHSEFFDSVEQIADAKAEIFDGVETGGAAVLNRDNPHFERLAAKALAAGVKRILTFGHHPEAGVRAVSAEGGPHGSDVEAVLGSKTLHYRIGIPGAHWVSNSLAVLTTVWAADGDVSAAAEALAEMEAPKGRGQCHRITLTNGTIELIDESYNASPVSMNAAFATLGQMRPEGEGRRIAVLGDMLELGDKSPALHAELAEPLTKNRIDLVFTAGADMASLWDALPKFLRGGHAAGSEALAPMVLAALRPGDIVMVKGSAGSRMGRIVEAIRDLRRGGNGSPRKAAVGR